jgi:hypothetical protein
MNKAQRDSLLSTNSEVGQLQGQVSNALGALSNNRPEIANNQDFRSAVALLIDAGKAAERNAQALLAMPLDDAPTTSNPPSDQNTGQGGESWSQFTEGTVNAADLSDEDTSLYMGQSASNAFYWKGIVRGSPDEMKAISDRWNHRGRFALDTPDKVAAYVARNTPLYAAYLANGGQPIA